MSFSQKILLSFSDKKNWIFFMVDNYMKRIHVQLKNSPAIFVEELAIILKCANLKVEV